jgi:hypothetical protein
VGRSPNTNFEPIKIPAPEVFFDGPQTIVTSKATGELKLYLPQCCLEVIVDNEDVLGIKRKKSRSFLRLKPLSFMYVRGRKRWIFWPAMIVLVYSL